MFNKKSAILIALVSELVAFELVLVYAGSRLDSHYFWPGYGVMAGAFSGLIAWVIHLMLAIKDLDGSKDE